MKNNKYKFYFICVWVISVFCLLILYIARYKDEILPVDVGSHSLTTRTQKIEVKIKGQTFTLEVAKSPAERAKGLMYRNLIPQNEGMLFIFDVAQIQTFWMKNTYIPLDIIFLDENKQVITIHKNARALDVSTTYSSTKPALYAIELNAGQSDKINLTLGDIINFII